MVIACAEAGASIFLEKPMCRNLVEADEMVAACEKHHVKLAIAHQTRYSPRLARVKDLINDAKVFGELVEMRAGFFPGGNFPASALITVSNFARPGMLIEIQGVAVIGG